MFFFMAILIFCILGYVGTLKGNAKIFMIVIIAAFVAVSAYKVHLDNVKWAEHDAKRAREHTPRIPVGRSY